MRAALVVLIVVATATTVRADDEIGVVVVGDVAMQPSVATYLEHWLKTHGHKIRVSPLSTDATNTIVNCLVIDDSRCARSVVEARSKAKSVVFARVDVTKVDKNVTFNLYWFTKGHEGIGERRVCERCTEDSWHGIADAMMSALAGSNQSEQGRVKIGSKPSGMIVLLDNVQIGVTPLELDVAVGHHHIELTHAGRSMGKREVDITAGDTESVTIRAKEEPGSSRLGPALLLGAGIVGLGTGAVYLYYGSIDGAGAKYTYKDSTPYGIGILAVGLGATIGGTILLAQSGSTGSTPIASIGPGGGYVGWMTRF